MFNSNYVFLHLHFQMKKNVHCEIGMLILYNEVCNTNYVVYTQFQKLISESLVIDLNKLLGNLKHFMKPRVLYFIESQNFIFTKNMYSSSGLLSISSKIVAICLLFYLGYANLKILCSFEKLWKIWCQRLIDGPVLQDFFYTSYFVMY